MCVCMLYVCVCVCVTCSEGLWGNASLAHLPTDLLEKLVCILSALAYQRLAILLPSFASEMHAFFPTCLRSSSSCSCKMFPDGRALIVNLRKKTVLHHFNFKERVYDLSYSPDGRSLSLSLFLSVSLHLW